MQKEIAIHAHLLNVIISCLRSNRPIKILDAGCGTLNFTKYLLKYLDKKYVKKIEIYGYEVADFYDKERIDAIIDKDLLLSASGIKNKISIVSIDSYRLPYEDDFFDFIISNQVIEHVANLHEFYSEQKRIINKEGFQIHCFPAKEIFVEPHLKMPLVHNLLNKRYAFGYLKFMYWLRGKKDPAFLLNRFNYMHTDTNYKPLSWHIAQLRSMNLNVRSCFNIYFPMVKVFNILGKQQHFKYHKLGLLERPFAFFSSYLYSTTIIASKSELNS